SSSTDTACILGKLSLSGRQELSQTASFWHPTPPFRLVCECAFRPITCTSTAAQSREHRSVSAGDVKEPDLIWRRLTRRCPATRPASWEETECWKGRRKTLQDCSGV